MMRGRRVWCCVLGAVLVSCGVCGCGSGVQRLMAVPSVVAMGVVDPIAGVEPAARSVESVVFLASGRVPEAGGEPQQPFSDARSHVLHLATARVSIGGGLSWEELAEATVGEAAGDRPVVEVEATEHFGVLWPTVPGPGLSSQMERTPTHAEVDATQRWVAEINAALEGEPVGEIIVFVHGYNTEFAVNTGMAAEIWHYGGRRGAVVSLAWPSRHRLLGYGADKANAAYSVRHLRLLLAFLAEETDAAKVHIVAHSAGCPIVVDALRELRLVENEASAAEVRARYRIGRVVLAAPDMDLMRFFNARLDGFDDLAERVVVYASHDDTALRLASLLFGDDRLGRSVAHLTDWERRAVLLFEDIELVDVSNPEDLFGDFLGHGYYHRDPWVSSDMLLFLRYGLTAGRRGLVRDIETGFWVFSEDYLERLRAIEVGEDGVS